VKRAVPLAFAIQNVSNPSIGTMDQLLKLSHDSDLELSLRAIASLGIVGAGTNNARLADILRNISDFYIQDSNEMFLTRISQGIMHMGKGMLSLQPYYSDRYILNKVAMAGLVIFMHASLDISGLLLGKHHFLYYYLALAAYPRMLFTLNESLENFPVQVRVGQAVDVVGQAGVPKKITGFQTHNSPVIISYGERYAALS